MGYAIEFEGFAILPNEPAAYRIGESQVDLLGRDGRDDHFKRVDLQVGTKAVMGVGRRGQYRVF